MNDKLSVNTHREIDALKTNWRALVMMCIAVLMLYALAIFIPAGWLTYALSCAALVMMCLTCLGRLNDIGPDKIGYRWNLRRLGFIIVGLASVTLLGMPFGIFDFPSWSEVFMRWGVMFVWLTTPGMPPWTKWIWGSAHAPFTGVERRAQP